MRETIAYVAMIVSFATAVTADVTIVWGLGARPPRWRALVALVFPLAGLYWAWREKMFVRAAVAVGACVVYALSRFA